MLDFALTFACNVWHQLWREDLTRTTLSCILCCRDGLTEDALQAIFEFSVEAMIDGLLETPKDYYKIYKMGRGDNICISALKVGDPEMARAICRLYTVLLLIEMSMENTTLKNLSGDKTASFPVL